MFGRHFDETDMVVSRVSQKHLIIYNSSIQVLASCGTLECDKLINSFSFRYLVNQLMPAKTTSETIYKKVTGN